MRPNASSCAQLLVPLLLLSSGAFSVDAYCREEGSCSGYTPYYHYRTSSWCCFMWSCYCSYCCDYPRYRPPPPPVYRPPPPAPDCSGTQRYTSSTGSFTDGSSTYSSYASNLDCRWLISPGYSGIKLSFSRFRTEATHDTVRIYDGSSTSSSLLKTYSGTSLPDYVVSGGSSLLVRFTSDSSVENTGFAVSYQRNVPASSCSSTTYLTSSSGSFTDGSSTYSDYTSNLNCRWLIQPGYSRIKLSFQRFQTENNYDKVYVYDGSSTSATRLLLHSGTSVPGSVVSSGSTMLVVFYSDSYTQRTGFQASYEQEATSCSGRVTLTSAAGSFTDGSVDVMQYANNKECSWLISPGYGPISLSFARFRTQAGYDFVKVYNGRVASSASLIASHSGTSVPSAPIQTPGDVNSLSTGHEMLVVFNTSSSSTDTGFAASYSQGQRSCWGATTLSSSEGSLSDGSAGGSAYTRGNACTWLISPGYQGIRLEFSRVSVLGPGDEVRFYSSASIDPATLIGTVSDLETLSWVTDDRVVVQSATSSLLVTFTSTLDAEGSWSTGFEGEYAADQGSACATTTTLTGSSGTFSDGSHSSDLYGSFLNCSWVIAPAGGGPVRLSILRLDTQSGVDVVHVFDGPEDLGYNLIGSFSGSSAPLDPIISKSPSMLVTFSSDAHRNGLGFEAAYSASCSSDDGSVLFDGDSDETVLYSVRRAPYGETCQQYGFNSIRVCRNGQLLSTVQVVRTTAEYTSCEVEQCKAQSVHVEPEGWLQDDLNFVAGQQPRRYQGGLNCGWLLWVGGSASSALSVTRRSVQATTEMVTALTFKRLNTTAGSDVVTIHKAAPANAAAMPETGALVAEMSGTTARNVLVEESPAVEIGFVTGSVSGTSGGTGWQVGYSSVSSACAFKVSSPPPPACLD